MSGSSDSFGCYGGDQALSRIGGRRQRLHAATNAIALRGRSYLLLHLFFTEQNEDIECNGLDGSVRWRAAVGAGHGAGVADRGRSQSGSMI